MGFVLTLVAADGRLDESLIDGLPLERTGGITSLSDSAADVPVRTRPDMAAVRAVLAAVRVDCFVTAEKNRRRKLLVADMDSTIVTSETLDEMAALAGIKDKIVPITERAMRGEIGFADALRERVAMLAGVRASVLDDVLRKTALSPGAAVLVATMKAHGAHCILASGGFTVLTSAVAAQCGFHAHHGNILEVADGKLTGRVAEPILNGAAKRDILNETAAMLRIGTELTMAIGDGSNDLPMLGAAGLGIGYRPKPVVSQGVDNCILYGDLTAALYAQGYREDEFASPDKAV